MSQMPFDLTCWRDQLDERQRKQIAFAELYVREFGHGVVGHNDYLLLARLTLLLDVAAGLTELPQPPAGGDFTLTFGKYRDKTLAEVWRLDPGYVEWLSREGRDAAVRTAARALLAPAQPTPAHAEADTPLSQPEGADIPF